MVSAAVLATVLRDLRGEDPVWASINYDQRTDWQTFGTGSRFAIVDFHFHPRAEYWFDHHPTTFLNPELRPLYKRSERWVWDESSPSCPPLVIAHAREHWGYQPPPRFEEMARWSNKIDAARYDDVEEAVFGDKPALRIARALTASPNNEWIDDLVGSLTSSDLAQVASRPDVEKVYQRAARNRDRALEQFPPTVESKIGRVLLYDASSHQIRRERFAPFYHHPDVHYAVGVIPTRAGFHVTAGENPWNASPADAHIGQIMEGYGGGGHKAVGGANPANLDAARKAAGEIAERLRKALAAQPTR
jgi:hypothetical protein